VSNYAVYVDFSICLQIPPYLNLVPLLFEFNPHSLLIGGIDYLYLWNLIEKCDILYLENLIKSNKGDNVQ